MYNIINKENIKKKNTQKNNNKNKTLKTNKKHKTINKQNNTITA